MYLRDRMGLDDALIAQVLDNYVLEMKSNLANGEVQVIEGLGNIRRLSDGGLRFESDPAYWGPDSVSDMGLTATPVPRYKTSITSAIESDESLDSSIEQTTDTFVDSSKEEDIEAIIPSEEVISTQDELQWEGEYDENEGQEQSLVDSWTDEDEKSDNIAEEADEKVVLLSESSIDEHSTIDASSHTAMEEQDRPRDKGRSLLLLLFLILIALALFIYLYTRSDQPSIAVNEPEMDQTRLNQSPTNEAYERVYQDESSMTAEESQDIDEKSVENNAATEPGNATQQNEAMVAQPNHGTSTQSPSSQSTIHTQENYIGGDCVVIVGAFADPANVQRMITRLKDHGWHTYEQYLGGLHRVGFYIPCRNPDRDRWLRIAQREIESKAWLLE